MHCFKISLIAQWFYEVLALALWKVAEIGKAPQCALTREQDLHLTTSAVTHSEKHRGVQYSAVVLDRSISS